jgi:hypothetical protein
MANELVSIWFRREDLILIDWALRERCATWERTEEYWEKGFVDGEIEESNSLYEASEMVENYQGLIASLSEQRDFLNSKSVNEAGDFVNVIYRRLLASRSELEDCRSEDADVTSIREEDALWVIAEYESFLLELVGCCFEADSSK